METYFSCNAQGPKAGNIPFLPIMPGEEVFSVPGFT